MCVCQCTSVFVSLCLLSLLTQNHIQCHNVILFCYRFISCTMLHHGEVGYHGHTDQLWPISVIIYKSTISLALCVCILSQLFL